MKESRFTVSPAETVRSWAHRTVTGLTGPVLADAGGDVEETAHGIRVATKQLRALLRLLRPGISKSAFEQTDARLKAAAGWLAAGRDRVVASKTLAGLAQNAGSEWLSHMRHELEEQATSDPKEHVAQTIDHATVELEKAVRSIQRMPMGNCGWAGIRKGMTAIYRRARRRMTKAARLSNDEALHRWRIPAKQLYYQLQWLEPVRPHRFSRMIRWLHQLEEKLGSLHDLAVLKEMLVAPAGGFVEAASARELTRAVDSASRHLQRKCQALGRKLFSRSPRAFSIDCRRAWKEWEK
jgi:CHAD domain-containing protein